MFLLPLYIVSVSLFNARCTYFDPLRRGVMSSFFFVFLDIFVSGHLCNKLVYQPHVVDYSVIPLQMCRGGSYIKRNVCMSFIITSWLGPILIKRSKHHNDSNNVNGNSQQLKIRRGNTLACMDVGIPMMTVEGMESVINFWWEEELMHRRLIDHLSECYFVRSIVVTRIIPPSRIDTNHS